MPSLRYPSSPSRGSQLLTLRQSLYLNYRTDFHGAHACPRNPRGNADRHVQVFDVDHEVAAQLLARFRERTIGHQPLAVAHLNRSRRRDRLQRGCGNKLAVLLEIVCELRRFQVTVRSFGFAHGLLVHVNQQHVLHVKNPPPAVDRMARFRIDNAAKHFLSSGMSPNASPMDAYAAVDAVYRSDWGRIVATLIRLIGDFDLAEEAAQEAFAVAVDKWRDSGVPQFPRAWIIEAARHKAIDRIRRRASFEEKLASYAASGLSQTAEEPEYDTDEIPDDRLR